MLSAEEQRAKVFSGWLCKIYREAFVCGVVYDGIKVFGGQNRLQKMSEMRLLLLWPAPAGVYQLNTVFFAKNC